MTQFFLDNQICWPASLKQVSDSKVKSVFQCLEKQLKLGNIRLSSPFYAFNNCKIVSNFFEQVILQVIQLPTFAITRLLNKPHENEVYFTAQKQT